MFSIGGTFMYDYIDIRVVHLSLYQYWAHATNIGVPETQIIVGNISSGILATHNTFLYDCIKYGVIH